MSGDVFLGVLYDVVATYQTDDGQCRPKHVSGAIYCKYIPLDRHADIYQAQRASPSHALSLERERKTNMVAKVAGNEILK